MKLEYKLRPLLFISLHTFFTSCSASFRCDTTSMSTSSNAHTYINSPTSTDDNDYFLISTIFVILGTWEGLCCHSIVCIDSNDVWNVSDCCSISGSGHSKCSGNGDVLFVSFHNTFRKLSPMICFNLISFNKFFPLAERYKMCLKSPCTVAWFSHIIYCLSDYQCLCKQLPKLVKLQKIYSMLSCLMNVD